MIVNKASEIQAEYKSLGTTDNKPSDIKLKYKILRLWPGKRGNPYKITKENYNTNICVELGGICITAELQKHRNW
jgi:hypothetical protein